MARHILARRGETLSALVKYLSNRAFHSRGCGVVRVSSGKRRRRGNDGEGRRHFEAPQHPLSLSVRYLVKARTTAPTKVQSRFYCPSLEGSLSTFLCPAEIHDARKCLLKISISVASLSLYFLPFPTGRFFCFTTFSVVYFSPRFPSFGENIEINSRFVIYII